MNGSEANITDADNDNMANIVCLDYIHTTKTCTI